MKYKINTFLLHNDEQISWNRKLVIYSSDMVDTQRAETIGFFELHSFSDVDDMTDAIPYAKRPPTVGDKADGNALSGLSSGLVVTSSIDLALTNKVRWDIASFLKDWKMTEISLQLCALKVWWERKQLSAPKPRPKTKRFDSHGNRMGFFLRIHLPLCALLVPPMKQHI